MAKQRQIGIGLRAGMPFAFQYWWGSEHLLRKGEKRKKEKDKRRMGGKGEKERRWWGLEHLLTKGEKRKREKENRRKRRNGEKK